MMKSNPLIHKCKTSENSIIMIKICYNKIIKIINYQKPQWKLKDAVVDQEVDKNMYME